MGVSNFLDTSGETDLPALAKRNCAFFYGSSNSGLVRTCITLALTLPCLALPYITLPYPYPYPSYYRKSMLSRLCLQSLYLCHPNHDSKDFFLETLDDHCSIVLAEVSLLFEPYSIFIFHIHI